MFTLEDGVQNKIGVIASFGCYALTLCKIAELSGIPVETYAAVREIEQAVSAGYIKDDMTVLDGAAFLTQMTLYNWRKEYKDAGYKPVEGDYLAAEWFNRRTGFTHFTLEYPVKWNSLKDSVTVKEGFIRSYRLYRVSD
jgi:hypothetical protein